MQREHSLMKVPRPLQSPVGGEKSGPITGTTVYTLTCTDADTGATKVRQVDVTITPSEGEV
jgi:hypothetical protein